MQQLGRGLRQLCSSAAKDSSSTRPLLLTLERSIGESFGSDTQLRSSGAFAAEVFPDLPIATTWKNFMKLGAK